MKPKQRHKLVQVILGYFTRNHSEIIQSQYEKAYLSFDNLAIEEFFKYYNIPYESGNCNENSIKQLLYCASDESIQNLYNYIIEDSNKYLSCFSVEKQSYIEQIFQNQDFVVLSQYLQSCYQCILQENAIAGFIVLRSCVEILLKHFCQKFRLESKIEEFIEKLEKEHLEFSKKFKQYNKIDELRHFLDEIKKFGDDAAHAKSDDLKSFTTAQLKTSYQIFCLLLEYTIFEKEIQKLKEKAEEMRFTAISFKKNDIYPISQNNNNTNIDAEGDVNYDKIPF